MTRWFVGVCAWILVASSAMAAESLAFMPSKYIARDVVGDVKVWTPFAPYWRRVVSDRLLPVDSLVSVGYASRVVIEMKGNASIGDIQGDRSSLSVGVPLVFRIEPGLYRKVKLKSFFLDRLPEIPKVDLPDDGKNPLEHLYSSFREAYERFSAFLVEEGGARAKPSIMEAEALANRINAGLVARKLDLILPGDGKMVIASAMPTKVECYWDRPVEDARQFAVYFWKPEVERSAPIAITRDTRYTLTAFEEGSYFVQVASVDGRFMSPVRMLHVALLGSDTVEVAEDGTKRRTQTIYGIETVAPPDGYQVVSSKDSATVTFAWEPGTRDRLDADYVLVIVDEKRREFARQRTRDVMTSYVVPRGKYHWHVELVAAGQDPTAVSVVRSPDRDLIVGGDPWDSLAGKQNRVVYLERGVQ